MIRVTKKRTMDRSKVNIIIGMDRCSGKQKLNHCHAVTPLIGQTSLTWTYAQVTKNKIILSLRSQLNNIHSTQHVHTATIKIHEDGRRRGSFLYTARPGRGRGQKTWERQIYSPAKKMVLSLGSRPLY